MRGPINLSIDVGSSQSGWAVTWPRSNDIGDLDVIDFGKDTNGIVRIILRDFVKVGNPLDVLSVEAPRAMGLPASNDLFETSVHVGRFIQLWPTKRWSYIFRPDVKLVVCGSPRAKDVNIRAALIDLWGGQSSAIGGKRCKRCSGKGHTGKGPTPCPVCAHTASPGWEVPPGPLYGMAADMWAALAVAVAWGHTQDFVQTIERRRKDVDGSKS